MGRLDEIRARMKAATPGPWVADKQALGRTFLRAPSGPRDHHGNSEPIATAEEHRDAVFIAHAPEDIAHLLAEVERLTRERDVATRGLDEALRQRDETRAVLRRSRDEFGDMSEENERLQVALDDAHAEDIARLRVIEAAARTVLERCDNILAVPLSASTGETAAYHRGLRLWATEMSATLRAAPRGDGGET